MIANFFGGHSRSGYRSSDFVYRTKSSDDILQTNGCLLVCDRFEYIPKPLNCCSKRWPIGFGHKSTQCLPYSTDEKTIQYSLNRLKACPLNLRPNYYYLRYYCCYCLLLFALLFKSLSLLKLSSN